MGTPGSTGYHPHIAQSSYATMTLPADGVSRSPHTIASDGSLICGPPAMPVAEGGFSLATHLPPPSGLDETVLDATLFAQAPTANGATTPLTAPNGSGGNVSFVGPLASEAPV